MLGRTGIERAVEKSDRWKRLRDTRKAGIGVEHGTRRTKYLIERFRLVGHDTKLIGAKQFRV